MNLHQGYCTPFGHGQQLCELLSRSNMTARYLGPDWDLRYVCILTLTLEILPWTNVMTHLWVIDNDCVRYHPDPTLKWRVMAQTRIFSMCTVILILKIWPEVKKMQHYRGMGNYCVKCMQIMLWLWPEHGFRVCLHCDMDLGDMTFGLGHDTPLGHWQ